MNLLSKIGHELKSLAFPGSLPTPHFSLPAYTTNLPGSHYDDHAAAGPLHENPAAAACFVALTKAFAQAHPFLEKRKAGNTWSRVDHPLTHLLKSPNPYYSGEKLFGVTLICAMSQGAAFWRLERDAKGDPSELWYEPPVGLGPSGIAPNWDKDHFIKDFHHFVDGQRNTAPIPREDVIYFRHGLNVANPRLPWSPLGLGAREIATLNHASSYTSAVMRNHGAPSGFISLESTATLPYANPEQAESLKSHIESKFGGPHNAGKTFVSSLPWKWNKVGLSPAEMVIDKIRQWPQETICALLGTPVIVALLPTGEQPTYQNLDASMRWWWDNTIIPLEDAFADEIETQLFPAFNLSQNDYRLSWDRSRIPALQEDEQAKHAMWREDYKAGCIDRYTYLTKIGEEADEKLKGVLHPSATPKPPQAPSENQKQLTAELKDQDFHEQDWVRKHGRFQHYVGPPARPSREKDHAPTMFADPGDRPQRDIDPDSPIPPQKIDKLQRKVNRTFESMHEWSGDPLPEQESPALQKAKAHVVELLEPHTPKGSDEASYAISMASAEQYGEFRTGTPTTVPMDFPPNDVDHPVAALHTHSRNIIFSATDWATFLSSRNIQQSHAVCPDVTHSLYKPADWKHWEELTSFGVTLECIRLESEHEADCLKKGSQATTESKRNYIAKAFCKRYGIMYREGKRSKD